MSNEHKDTAETDMAPRMPVALPSERVKRWRRLVRVRNGIIGVWIGGLATEIVVFPLMGVFPAIKYQILYGIGALTVCWFGAACAGLAFNSYLEDHIQRTFRSKDITSLGCWIDVLFSPVSKIAFPQEAKQNYEAARAGLLEQLPLLTEDTAHLLRVDERHALYKTLYGTDAELIPVVLRVLPVFHDARALPFIRHLAEGKGLTVTNTHLQAEAQSSLSRLQANLDLNSGARGLLRASQHPQSPEEELLLPAHANGDTEAGELLRADIQK
jgi:hypothetical protein